MTQVRWIKQPDDYWYAFVGDQYAGGFVTKYTREDGDVFAIHHRFPGRFQRNFRTLKAAQDVLTTIIEGHYK